MNIHEEDYNLKIERTGTVFCVFVFFFLKLSLFFDDAEHDIEVGKFSYENEKRLGRRIWVTMNTPKRQVPFLYFDIFYKSQFCFIRSWSGNESFDANATTRNKSVFFYGQDYRFKGAGTICFCISPFFREALNLLHRSFLMVEF